MHYQEYIKTLQNKFPGKYGKTIKEIIQNIYKAEYIYNISRLIAPLRWSRRGTDAQTVSEVKK